MNVDGEEFAPSVWDIEVGSRIKAPHAISDFIDEISGSKTLILKFKLMNDEDKARNGKEVELKFPIRRSDKAFERIMNHCKN